VVYAVFYISHDGINTKLLALSKKVNLEFTVEEFQAFIAVHIVMGLLHLPQIKDY